MPCCSSGQWLTLSGSSRVNRQFDSKSHVWSQGSHREAKKEVAIETFLNRKEQKEVQKDAQTSISVWKVLCNIYYILLYLKKASGKKWRWEAS